MASFWLASLALSLFKPVDGGEDEVGVVRGVAQREDLFIHVLECVLVDDAVGALLLESSVQTSDLT